jgi:flagellar assembly protein FliH
MSSKVVRGPSPATEPLAWQRVSPFDAINNERPVGSSSSEGLAVEASELEQRIREAQQQGYEEGQAIARQAHAAQLEAMQVKLARTIEEITGLRQRYRHAAEQDVVGLALAVARRILHRELTVAPDALLGLVKAALEKLDANEVQRVRVSRQDAALVGAFLEKMGLPQRIEVTADPTLAPGSVVLETTRGLLDASVDTQLNEIDRGFADLIRRAE